MIKAVIFDLDNTLLDFIKMKSIAIKSAINGMIEAGLEVDPVNAFDELMKIYEQKGYEYQEVFDVFLSNHIGKLNYKYLAAGIVSYRMAKEASLILYPNVNSTLIKLSKRGLKLGVLSDAPSREAWMRIYYVNLHHTFDAVVTYDDTGKTKPSPEPFLKVCDQLKINPKDSIMVGDWPDRDIVGAKDVGMLTAFAKYGDSFDTIHSKADYDLECISDILDIIKKINKT